MTSDRPVVMLISAGTEWRVVRSHYQPVNLPDTPYGQYFQTRVGGREVIFVQGGWGKISAAGSAQYAIDRWNPKLIINFGTCGGLEGRAAQGEIFLVEKTLVYDIFEEMGDPHEAIKKYQVELDLSWLRPPYPLEVRRTRLLSADRDIQVAEIPNLISRYQAAAADWESGAIAWVASHNHTRCLILRGVTDIVGAGGGEAYGNLQTFAQGTQTVMARLLLSLPAWLNCVES